MSDKDTPRLDRRHFFRGAAGIGAATALPAAPALAQSPQPPVAPTPAPAPGSLAAWRAGHRERPAAAPYRFLNAAEAAFVEAAVDRLIPEDAQFPGALWAGVASYIDGQLAGAYGQGARFFASGPWAEGTPSQGYQLPLTPAQLYRTSLAALAELPQGRDFAKASPEAQDAFLAELEAGRHKLANVPSSWFFETLLANTIEGWLSDPSYGGNRDMVGWRMIGFPGAYAAYLQLYTHHGMKFENEPIGMGEIARHGHGTEGHRHG